MTDSAQPHHGPFLGTDSVFQGPKARHGDLLPLPLPSDEFFKGSICELSSRRAQLRVGHRRKRLDRVRGTIWALNNLAGFKNVDSFPSRPLNAAQEAAIKRVEAAHQHRPPPVLHETPGGALRQLLKNKASSNYGEPLPEGPGSLASYVRDRVSLPQGLPNPTPLDSILPEVEKERLCHFERDMMLSGEEIAAVMEQGFSNDCYMDPQLTHDPSKYHNLVGDLCSCNLLGFTDQPRVQVGLFFVTKKNHKQRMIIDARRTNKLFRKPPTTVLGSVDAWSRVEVPSGDPLFLAQEDVRDYFYRLGIDKELGQYFCLPPVDPLLLEKSMGKIPEDLVALQGQSTGPYYPYMRVLPMGFAWSFHLAHEAHCEVARRVLPGVPFLQDRTPAPVMGRGQGQHRTSLLVYADNCNHMGIDSSEVAGEQKTVRETLHQLHLDTHDIAESSTLAESLGVRVNGLSGEIQPTPHRDWRLDRALWALSTRPYITGEQLQVVVGHMTVRALLHRGLMCILRHAYTFIEQSYTKKQRLWPSVAEEMEMFRNLLPIAKHNMQAPWDSFPLCTDASLSGYAVMEGDMLAQEIAPHGRQDERWRYRRLDGAKVAPRDTALDSSLVFEDVNTVKPLLDGEIDPGWEVNNSFREIPADMMDENRWKLLWNSQIHFKEPIHLIEARGVLAAIKHRTREWQRHGTRILVLNDNLGVVLSIQKGRSSSYSLLRLIRRISAHCLAANIRLVCRWIPSELNTADHASRVWEAERKAGEPTKVGWERKGKKERGKGFQQEGSGGVQCTDEKSDTRESPESEEKIQVPIEIEGSAWECASGLRLAENGQSSSKETREGSGQTEKIRPATSSQQGREVNPGDGVSERSTEEGLCAEAGDVLQFCGKIWPRHLKRAVPRCRIVRLCRSHVLERRVERFWPQAESSHRVRDARRSSRTRPETAPFETGLEGLAETSPKPDKVANAGVPQVSSERSDVAPRTPHDEPVQRSDVLHVLPAWGVAESASSGHSREEQQLPTQCDHPFTIRKGRSKQSRDLRRGPDFGRSTDAMPGEHTCGRSKGCFEQEGRRSSSLGLHSSSIPQSVASSSRCFGHRRYSRVALPEQTFQHPEII